MECCKNTNGILCKIQHHEICTAPCPNISRPKNRGGAPDDLLQLRLTITALSFSTWCTCTVHVLLFGFCILKLSPEIYDTVNTSFT